MKRAGLVLLGIYKLVLSPVAMMFGARCRYAPSCSDYAREAISRHGLWAGGWMALARLQRCAPWGGAGMDAVPEIPDSASLFTPWRYGVWVHRATCEDCYHADPDLS